MTNILLTLLTKNLKLRFQFVRNGRQDRCQYGKENHSLVTNSPPDYFKMAQTTLRTESHFAQFVGNSFLKRLLNPLYKTGREILMNENRPKLSNLNFKNQTNFMTK